MFQNFDLQNFVVSFVILILAITLHEAGHAFAADWCGDNTPRSQGRLTFNPLDHLDPIGTILMVFTLVTGFGLGWGRAVIVNPHKFRHPRWDMLKVAIAGPIMNVFQAIFYTVVIRVCEAISPTTLSDFQYNFLATGIQINIALILFNLIPIPPLDGSKVLSVLLPIDAAMSYDKLMGNIGRGLVLLLVLTHMTRYIVSYPAVHLTNMLTGF